MSFIDATRQNFTELPSQPYVEGGRFYFQLPKVGLLSRLFLKISGTCAVTPGTGTAAISERTIYNIFKRIRLVANSGTSIYDMSGYGGYLVNLHNKHAFNPLDSIPDAGIDALVTSFAVAEGDNSWVATLEIPIAINERDPIGLIMLQNNTTQLVLEVDLNPLYATTDIAGAIKVTGNATAAFTGKIGCMMEYFTVPRNVEDYPAINVIHQWLEQQEAITSAGEFRKSLLRQNTYMRLLHYVTISGALNSAAVESQLIKYNQSETPYMTEQQTQLYLQRARYGRDLPKGTISHDWYMSNGIPGLGNSRDFINSAAVTEFQTVLNIKSGTTVTAGTSFVNTITEQLIRIA